MAQRDELAPCSDGLDHGVLRSHKRAAAQMPVSHEMAGEARTQTHQPPAPDETDYAHACAKHVGRAPLLALIRADRSGCAKHRRIGDLLLPVALGSTDYTDAHARCMHTRPRKRARARMYAHVRINTRARMRTHMGPERLNRVSAPACNARKYLDRVFHEANTSAVVWSALRCLTHTAEHRPASSSA
jgi:hypothetical protein